MSLGTGPGLAYFVPLHVVQFIHIQGLGVPRGVCVSNSCSGQFFFFPISAVKCSYGFIWLLGKVSEVQALSFTRRMYVDGLSAVSGLNQQNHQSLGWFPAPVLWTTEAFQSSLWLVCGMVWNSNTHSLQLKFLLEEFVAVCKKIWGVRVICYLKAQRMFAVQEYVSGHGPWGVGKYFVNVFKWNTWPVK